MKLIKLLSCLIIAISILGCKHDPDKRHDDDLHEALHPEYHDDTRELSVTRQIQDLREKGFEIFEFIDCDTGDTIIMQQYFMAFLKRGPKRNWTKEEADSIQALHMAHLGRMYEEGYADMSGPFGDDQDLRGITIYNVPTFQMADSLARLDPSVQAGNLEVEVRPWWAGKGYPLR